jgi:hypothetical protein
MENKYIQQEFNFNTVMSIIDKSLNVDNKYACNECGAITPPDEWSDSEGLCISCA